MNLNTKEEIKEYIEKNYGTEEVVKERVDYLIDHPEIDIDEYIGKLMEDWSNKTIEDIFLDRLGVYPTDVKKILESPTRFNIYPQISWVEKFPVEKKCKLDLFSFVSCIDELLREIDYVAQKYDVAIEKQIIKEAYEDFPEHFVGIKLKEALAAIDHEKETLVGLSSDLKYWTNYSKEYKKVIQKENIIAKEGYAKPTRDAVNDSKSVGKGAVGKPVGVGGPKR